MTINGEYNVQVNNGTLKLNVSSNTFLDGWKRRQSRTIIKTKESFKNARVEIRAKKSIKKTLWAKLRLDAVKGEYFDIAKLNGNRITLESPASKYFNEDTKENLTEYQVYSIEWNETYIEWFINQRSIRRFVTTDEQVQDWSHTAFKGCRLYDDCRHLLPFNKSFTISFQAGHEHDYLEK